MDAMARHQRQAVVRSLNARTAFRAPDSLDAWRARAANVRRHILVGAGLVPEPARTLLRARIAGLLLRDGYSIEKVVYESRPGFAVGANLWRPLGRGKGPFPAVLHPHGHWEHGRIADDDDGSSIALCSNLARQGYVVLAWDMIGYNDTRQLSHCFHSRRAELWGVSVLGLQLWNAIRAVDLLASLPDVDARRMGVV